MAGKYDFEIEQGATLRRSFVWTDSDNNPINLTGTTSRLQVKDRNGVLLSDWSNYLTVTPLDGQVDLLVPATATTALTFDTAYYDLKIDGGADDTTRLLEGVIENSRQVTV